MSQSKKFQLTRKPGLALGPLLLAGLTTSHGGLHLGLLGLLHLGRFIPWPNASGAKKGGATTAEIVTTLLAPMLPFRCPPTTTAEPKTGA